MADCQACAEREATIAALHVELQRARDVLGAIPAQPGGLWLRMCAAMRGADRLLTTPDPGRRWLEAVEQAAKTLRYIESTVLPAFALYAKDDEPMGTNLRNISETVRANVAALEALR